MDDQRHRLVVHERPKPLIAPAADIYLDAAGAAGDGVTSDARIFQAALDAASEYNGWSNIHLGTGKTYLVDRQMVVRRRSSKIRITGAGTLKTTAASGIYFDNWYDQHTEQPITGGTRGAYSVATTSPAAGITPGDFVFVYTGNTTGSSQPLGAPDSEINLVSAVSGSTVTLAWPLCKNYAQEYFQPGEDKTNGITSTSYTGTAAPLALRKIEPVTDFTIDGITVDHRGSSAFLTGDLVVRLSVAGVTAATKGGFQSMSTWTGTWTGNTLAVEDQHAQWFAVGYGARDVTLSSSTLTATTLGSVHCTEGAKITLSDVTITNASGITGGSTAVLSFRGRGYDITLTDVTMTNAGSYGGLYVDAGIDGSATNFVATGTGTLIVNGSSLFTVNGVPGS